MSSRIFRRSLWKLRWSFSSCDQNVRKFRSLSSARARCGNCCTSSPLNYRLSYLQIHIFSVPSLNYVRDYVSSLSGVCHPFFIARLWAVLHPMFCRKYSEVAFFPTQCLCNVILCRCNAFVLELFFTNIVRLAVKSMQHFATRSLLFTNKFLHWDCRDAWESTLNDCKD